MAAKRSSRSRTRVRPPRPAAWWGAIRAPESRRVAAVKIREEVKLLRRFFVGFGPGDGYDLRYPQSIPKAKLNRMAGRMRYLRYLQSTGPFKKFVPKTKKSRAVARSFTMQRAPDQKVFLVHMPAPEKSRVIITKKGRMEIERQLPTHKEYKRFYLFKDFVGYQPVLFEDMLAAAQEMIPEMPKGMYQLWGPQGTFLQAHERDMLPNLINRFFVQGDSGGVGFAGVVVGFIYHGTRARSEVYNNLMRVAKERQVREKYERQAKQFKNNARFMSPSTIRRARAAWKKGRK